MAAASSLSFQCGVVNSLSMVRGRRRHVQSHRRREGLAKPRPLTASGTVLGGGGGVAPGGDGREAAVVPGSGATMKGWTGGY